MFSRRARELGRGTVEGRKVVRQLIERDGNAGFAALNGAILCRICLEVRVRPVNVPDVKFGTRKPLHVMSHKCGFGALQEDPWSGRIRPRDALSNRLGTATRFQSWSNKVESASVAVLQKRSQQCFVCSDEVWDETGTYMTCGIEVSSLTFPQLSSRFDSTSDVAVGATTTSELRVNTVASSRLRRRSHHVSS
jgi:hypothetical protein